MYSKICNNKKKKLKKMWFYTNKKKAIKASDFCFFASTQRICKIKNSVHYLWTKINNSISKLRSKINNKNVINLLPKFNNKITLK